MGSNVVVEYCKPQANFFRAPDPHDMRSRAQHLRGEKASYRPLLSLLWEAPGGGKATLWVGAQGAADSADVLRMHGITHKLCVAGTESGRDR